MIAASAAKKAGDAEPEEEQRAGFGDGAEPESVGIIQGVAGAGEGEPVVEGDQVGLGDEGGRRATRREAIIALEEAGVIRIDEEGMKIVALGEPCGPVEVLAVGESVERGVGEEVFIAGEGKRAVRPVVKKIPLGADDIAVEKVAGVGVDEGNDVAIEIGRIVLFMRGY